MATLSLTSPPGSPAAVYVKVGTLNPKTLKAVGYWGCRSALDGHLDLSMYVREIGKRVWEFPKRGIPYHMGHSLNS